MGIVEIFQGVTMKIEEKLTEDGILVNMDILNASDREWEKVIEELEAD